MKMWSRCLLLLAVLGLAAPLQAETDLMEAAPPAGTYFQWFQIYQNFDDIARDDIRLSDLDVDAYVSLFRIAKWWDNGVFHVVVPVGWVGQEARVDTPGGRMTLWDGHECGMGDMFVGGGPRFINEAKDTFFVPGIDLRLPTGNYDSDEDAGSGHWAPHGGSFNMGTGSFSVQPFAILTKMFNQGLIASDTEVRYSFNTSAGPIQYNPDDRLEVWQNVSLGLAPNFRVGAFSKYEFELCDDDHDDDHASFIAVGPGLMYMIDDIVIWGKVLFDVASEDSPEKCVTAYMRMSIPF